MFGDTPSNRKRLLRSLKNGEVKGKKFGKRWFVYSTEIRGEELKHKLLLIAWSINTIIANCVGKH
jgi:hypothetical protein